MSTPTIIDLKPLIHDAGLSTEVSPVACVVEAYTKLKAAEDPLTADEESLLFESAMLIGEHGFGQMGVEAITTVSELVELRGLAHFRPEPVVEDPPQP